MPMAERQRIEIDVCPEFSRLYLPPAGLGPSPLSRTASCIVLGKFEIAEYKKTDH